MVATDIAARGIHVDGIELVVHADPPTEHKAYTHRSGRTARAGTEGTVVTVQTAAQVAEVRTLMRKAGVSPRTSLAGPGSAVLREIAGPPAKRVLRAAARPQRDGDGVRGGWRSAPQPWRRRRVGVLPRSPRSPLTGVAASSQPAGPPGPCQDNQPGRPGGRVLCSGSGPARGFTQVTGVGICYTRCSWGNTLRR